MSTENLGIVEESKEENTQCKKILVLDGISYPLNMGRLVKDSYVLGFDLDYIVQNEGYGSCSTFNWKCLKESGLIPGWKLPYQEGSSQKLI